MGVGVRENRWRMGFGVRGRSYLICSSGCLVMRSTFTRWLLSYLRGKRTSTVFRESILAICGDFLSTIQFACMSIVLFGRSIQKEGHKCIKKGKLFCKELLSYFGILFSFLLFAIRS